MMEKASEWIKDAICVAGTPVSVCGFCQRSNFCNGPDMDDGEYEELVKNAVKEPSCYREHLDADYLSIGQIEGINYVWNCGCEQSEERLSRIENFLWSHQRIIDSYYKRRIKAMKDEAATRETMVQP